MFPARDFFPPILPLILRHMCWHQTFHTSGLSCAMPPWFPFCTSHLLSPGRLLGPQATRWLPKPSFLLSVSAILPSFSDTAFLYIVTWPLPEITSSSFFLPYGQFHPPLTANKLQWHRSILFHSLGCNIASIHIVNAPKLLSEVFSDFKEPIKEPLCWVGLNGT